MRVMLVDKQGELIAEWTIVGIAEAEALEAAEFAQDPYFMIEKKAGLGDLRDAEEIGDDIIKEARIAWKNGHE